MNCKAHYLCPSLVPVSKGIDFIFSELPIIKVLQFCLRDVEGYNLNINNCHI